mmetsp:Transcript_72988/g.142822  ORF Transcript_72988/g.142822 Transcript_72988/m.142822 type:complete len:246 (-) Transcript_72988:403-1140(-)
MAALAGKEGTGSGRGAFIVFEGVDRCGKSTQAAKLAEALGAESMRFPDRTTAIGVMINSYLAQGVDMDDRAVHLLFSANRWEAKARIEETLAAGKHIVCDRYAFSGVAFSGAKEGLDLEWCANPDRGLPAPDAVLYLELSVEKAMLRGEFGAERYEKEEFQRTVAKNFKLLMAKDDGVPTKNDGQSADDDAGAVVVPRNCSSSNTAWHVLDASLSIEELHTQIKAVALATADSVKNDPVGKLWVT